MSIIAGSKYAQTGLFEVTKAEDEPEISGESSPDPGGIARPVSALRVIIPSELQGVAYIGVIVQKGNYCPIYLFIFINFICVNVSSFGMLIVIMILICNNNS